MVSVLSTLKGMLSPSVTRDDFGESEARVRESQMFELKASLLLKARESAKARGEKPTLEDYRSACEEFSQTPEGQSLIKNGEWGPKSYANLKGQNLSGFSLSDPKKRPMSDLLDLDSDGAINEFYTNVSFHQANLNNAYVDPATSFNEEIAKAANLKGLTFNDMKEGETFRFAGHYEDIRLQGIEGGKIEFASGSVNGLEINGRTARISLGENTVVNDISVSDEFRILALSMGKGSVISGDLKQSTLSMACEFEIGATFHNVQMSNNVQGLDFSGLRLLNVAIDNVPLRSPADLDKFGIKYDPQTTQVAASDEFIRESALKRATEQAIGAGMSLNAAMKRVHNTDAPAAGPTAPESAIALSGISGGESVNLNQIGLTHQVASLERTVDPNEVATGANMNRKA